MKVFKKVKPNFNSNKDEVEVAKLKKEIEKLNDIVINSSNENTISYLVGRGVLDLFNSDRKIDSAYSRLRVAYSIFLRNQLDKGKDISYINKLAIPLLNIDLSEIFFKDSIKSTSQSNGKQHLGRSTKPLKSVIISVPKKSRNELKDSYSQALTLLDPISEECWNDAFNGYGIVKNSYKGQIQGTKSDFAFFESAWKANKGQWIYAFNSPNLQHDNAQKLLDVIGLLRQKNVPIIFWNKEDPMHYEMYKPIAKEADFVFTTDALIVDKYKRELKTENVWALPFAAPVSKTNPIGRFKENSESVCFAGTYYAQNHLDRKNQMDKLLPALLDNNGVIYDRASQDKSDRYSFPSEYSPIIRDGVGFEEMMRLYKKFKVFLNVNTIVNSPTMMSRRVYELLASGTPVLSTPSKAITSQFPGIVLTASNKDEANIAVNKLLSDNYFWHRQSILGIREVMLKHTYGKRWEHMKDCIKGVDTVTPPTIVSVIANYTGVLNINSFVSTIIDQKGVEIGDLIIIDKSRRLNTNLRNKIDNHKNIKVKVVDNYSSASKHIKSFSGQYIYFTEDTIINLQHAVLDLVLATNYCDKKSISRKVYYKLESLEGSKTDESVFKVDPNECNWYSGFSELTLQSVLIEKSHLESFSINELEWSVHSHQDNEGIFQIDPFNIISINMKYKNRQIKENLINNFIYKYNSWLGV